MQSFILLNLFCEHFTNTQFEMHNVIHDVLTVNIFVPTNFPSVFSHAKYEKFSIESMLNFWLFTHEVEIWNSCESLAILHGNVNMQFYWYPAYQ